MQTSVLIDLILAYTDNVSATDADNTSRRARILQAAQERFDYVWNYRDWPFTYKRNTVTVTTTGIGLLPADFGDIGLQGFVYNSSVGAQMTEVPFQDLIIGREQGIIGQANSFSILGYDNTTQVKAIQIAKGSASQSLVVWYKQLPPTLVDDPSVTSKLAHIPPAYHNSVILPGVIARIRKSKGDSRNWDQEFKEGLLEMVARERPHKSSIQRPPRAISNW